MQSGHEQTSLWVQSSLLDLVAPPAQPAEPSQLAESSHSSATTPDRTSNADVGVASATTSAAGEPALVVAEAAETDPPAVSLSTEVSADDHEAAALATPCADDTPAAPAATREATVEPPVDAPPSQHSAAEVILTADDTTMHASAADLASSGPTDAASRQPRASLSAPPPLPSCPERLLILDTETTALSPQQGECIEVGAVLFDVASRSVLMQLSFLLPCDHNPAQHVNGIPAAVSRLSQPWQQGLACFEAMVAGADAVLAHNVAFDRQWFGRGELPALEKPWICSMEDIRWPAERHLRANPSVRDLALAYGVPVWAAHRALTDCIYLVQVFQRCQELEALLQAALEPRHLVRARLSYDERQLAKDAGFRWNEPVPKAWSRRLSDREIAALPFAVDPVEAEEPSRPRGETPQPFWRRSA